MSITPEYAVCSPCGREFSIKQKINGCPICPKCGKQATSECAENVLYRYKLKLNKYVEIEEHTLQTYHGSTVDWKKFSYPFRSFHDNVGCWSSIAFGKKTEQLSKDNLLDLDVLKSSKVYFHQIGECDEDAWIFIIKRPDNVYLYFSASCDYTGFDCRGGGDLFYIKDDWSAFWKKCLDNSGRGHIYTVNNIRTIQSKGRTLTVIPRKQSK
jgi:hypothetical protein